MRIDLALMCDYALVDRANKLTAAGIFRGLAGPSLPFTHPRMYLALALVVEPEDRGDHELTLRLIDPDGSEVVKPLKARIHVDRTDPIAEGVMNFVLELTGVKFRTTGTHCFDLFLDGEFATRVELNVVVRKPPRQKESASEGGAKPGP